MMRSTPTDHLCRKYIQPTYAQQRYRSDVFKIQVCLLFRENHSFRLASGFSLRSLFIVVLVVLIIIYPTRTLFTDRTGTEHELHHQQVRFVRTLGA